MPLKPNLRKIKHQKKTTRYIPVSHPICFSLAAEFPELQGKKIYLPFTGRNLPLDFLLDCIDRNLRGLVYFPKYRQRSLSIPSDLIQKAQKHEISGRITIPKFSIYQLKLIRLIQIYLKEYPEENFMDYNKRSPGEIICFLLPKPNNRDKVIQIWEECEKRGICFDAYQVAKELDIDFKYVRNISNRLRQCRAHPELESENI